MPVDAWKKLVSGVRTALRQERRQFDLETEAELEGVIVRSWRDETQRVVFALNLINRSGDRIDEWHRRVLELYLRHLDEQQVEETPDLLKAIFQRAVIPEIQAQSRHILLLVRRLARREGISRNIVNAEAANLRELTAAIAEDCEAELRREQQVIRGTTKIRGFATALEAKRSPGRTFGNSRSRTRALTVAKLIGELDQLEFCEGSYEDLRAKHRRFLTFTIAANNEKFRIQVASLQQHRRHILLAQELAAAHHGRKLNTIKTDWKKHKPKKFRNLQQ